MSDNDPKQPGAGESAYPPPPPAPTPPPYAAADQPGPPQPPYAAPEPAAPTAAQPPYPAAGYPQQAPPSHAPGYPAPAYPQQQYPAAPLAYGQQYAYAAAPKNNALAIVSLVSGIAGLTILFGVASIVAVITGHISLKQLKTNGEAGRGMALTGTILGWVGVGLGVLFLVLGFIWFAVLFGTLASTDYSYS